MNITVYTLQSNDLDSLVDYLGAHLSFDYENHSTDMSIIFEERYYWRNKSTQLNMIIAKREKSKIQLDVIAGAGGTGFFNLNRWSEKGYLKRVRKVLDKFTTEFGLELAEEYRG